MLSRDKKAKIAKAKQKLDKPSEPAKALLEINNKDIIELHNDFNDLAKLLQNTLTDTTFKEDVAQQLTDLNNLIVRLVQNLGAGIMVKNKDIFDEVTVKNLSDIEIPSEITVKNPTEIPSDLATNKNIKQFQEALVQSLGSVQKAVEKNANSIRKAVEESDPGQSEADYVPYRRVIMRNKRLEFDDATISQLRFPIPPISFADSTGRQLFGLVDSVTRRLQVDAALTVENIEIGKVDQGTAGANSWKVVEDNSASIKSDLDTLASIVSAGALAVKGTLTVSDGTNNISITTAGADGTSNTFNGLRTSAHLKVFNGTTWDRMPGDTTGISVKSHAVTNTGTFAVQAAQSGTWTVQPGNTPNTTPWLVANSPVTSGGLSVASGSIGAAATSVKASAGQVYGWYFYNSNSTIAYVQFFDLAAGSVTLGSTTPKFSLGIPPNSGANVAWPQGISHATAITIAVTTTRAGLTAPTNTVDYNVFYA